MKRKLQSIVAVVLAIMMCMQVDYIPAKASTGDVSGSDVSSGDVSGSDVSSGDISGGDLNPPEEKTITVNFDTTYATGYYKVDEEWNEISDSLSLVITEGEEFSIAVKTDAPAFVAGYEWSGATNSRVIKGNETTELEIRKDWSSLNDNEVLTIAFEKAISAENFTVTFSELQGTYGHSTKASLCFTGTEAVNLANTEIKWSSNHSGFVSTEQTTANNVISQSTYVVNCNEKATVNAIAKIYRNDVLLCTVTSEAYQMIKDAKAPEVTEVLYSRDGKNFSDLEGRRAIWGAKEVYFRVKVTDENGELPVSGTKKVNIYIDNDFYEMQYNAENGYYEHTVSANWGVVWLFKVKIDAWDNAGNHVLKEDYPQFGIDKKGPEIKVKLVSGEEEITGWYSEAIGQESLVFEVTATDDNKVNTVEVATKSDFSTGSVVASLEPVLQDGKYVIKTSEGLISGEQNQTYYFRAKDEFDNVSEVANKLVQIDNTAPNNAVTVGFTGTEDMLVEVENYDNNTSSYVVTKGEGIVYDNDKIALRLFAKDGITSGLTANVSGIAKVDFDVIIENSAGETTIGIHRTEEDFTLNGDGEVIVYYDTPLPDGLETFEQSYRIENVVITDKAGNVCPIDLNQEDTLLNDNVLYVIDNQAPEITYTYSNEEVEAVNVVENEGVKTFYYNQEFTGNVTITDMNLVLDSIRIFNMEDYAEAVFGENQNVSNEQLWKNAVFAYSLSEDGCYRIVTEADDILNNATEGEEVAQAASEVLIIDMTAPSVGIQVTDATGQALSDYAGKYYATDLGAGLKIIDKNLDMGSVTVTISGRGADGTVFTQELSQDSWQNDGDEYTNSCHFSKEGSYVVTVSCKDMAGNETTVSTQTFYIDKTVPTAEIVFDNMNAANGFYFNADRKAVITVKDYSFNPQAAEVMIQAQYGKSATISEWTHHASEACQGTHTKDCTHSAVVTFSQDDVYDMAFQCVDYAGNSSEKYDGGHFVIDKTAPIITISYNHDDVKHEIYYNQARRATIAISDLSFAGEKSIVSKLEAEGLSELPAQSTWQAVGGNQYTKQIDFAQDGIYQYQVNASDLAGNQAQIVYSDYFIMDLTAPRLEISGVNHRSANNGAVIPVITYGDRYLDDTQAVISVNGIQNQNFQFAYEKVESGDGYQITGRDFPYTASTDDLYKLTAKVEDYAGNISEQSIVFSVNRFGSIYVISEATREWLDGYYTNSEKDVVVTEINVDELAEANVTVIRDGEIFPLKAVYDYQIENEGTEDSWKSYTYVISKENFEQEGHYTVSLSSEDAAQNKSDNKVKGVEITFAVDKTAPQMVVEGIEANGIYKQESLTVRTDIQDNMELNQLSIYIGGQLWKTFDRTVLELNAGQITFELPETEGKTDIKLVAEDAVGNSSEKLFSDVVISTNYKIIEDTMTAKAAGFNLFNDNKIYLWLVPGIILLIGILGMTVIIMRKKTRQ